MHQNRGKVINKLALVLLSIVVLELLLIGDHQVQSVKALKKKILLKKLKKILPLLALVKPKKKLILVPIPIPMFNKHQPNNYNQQQPFAGSVGSSRPVMMMTADGSAAPMTVVSMAEPMVELSGAADSSSMPPSMTMTIHQPEGSIELSTSVSNSSSALMLRPRPQANQQLKGATKWQAIQQQQQLFDQFDFEPLSEQLQQHPGGEHYYSSPWSSASRRPLASPAKLLRNERLKKQQQNFRPTLQMVPPTPPTSTLSQLRLPATLSRLRDVASGSLRTTQAPQVAQMPLVVIKNQWQPSSSSSAGGGATNQAKEQLRAAKTNEQSPAQNQRQMVIQHQQADLIQVGPPQLMPIYQTSNGQFHMTPPPPMIQQQQLPALNERLRSPPTFEQELIELQALEKTNTASHVLDTGELGNLNLAEVQTTGNNNNANLNVHEQGFGEIIEQPASGRHHQSSPGPPITSTTSTTSTTTTTTATPPISTTSQHLQLLQHHNNNNNNYNHNNLVQQHLHLQPEPYEPRGRPPPPSSPIKGKQQQPHSATTKRKPIAASGGY